MAITRRAYGAPKEEGKPQKSGVSSTGKASGQPQVKQEDPSPPTRVVDQFHKNAPVDTRPEDIHHRIGSGAAQAASGQHRHNGTDSPLLLEGVILTGSRGGNAAVLSIVNALKKLGATDSTTA